MTKKRSLFGALPQLHIPQKSHANTKPPPRPKRTVVKDLEIEEQASVHEIQGFCRRVEGLNSREEWEIKNLSDSWVV